MNTCTAGGTWGAKEIPQHSLGLAKVIARWETMAMLVDDGEAILYRSYRTFFNTEFGKFGAKNLEVTAIQWCFFVHVSPTKIALNSILWCSCLRGNWLVLPREINTSWIYTLATWFHQKFHVPKTEVLNLIRLFWGWGFPYISLTCSLHRWVPPF